MQHALTDATCSDSDAAGVKPSDHGQQGASAKQAGELNAGHEAVIEAEQGGMACTLAQVQSAKATQAQQLAHMSPVVLTILSQLPAVPAA